MKPHYWQFLIYCDGCKQPAHLQLMKFSSDGELVFTAYCFSCKKEIVQSIFASQFAQIALYHDITEFSKKFKTPPKALPAPNGLTPDDQQFLRDFHIGEDA